MAFNGKLRPKCSIEGCLAPNFSLTYCDMHYRRFKRHGDPNYINPKCNRDGNYKKRARTKTAQWKKDNKKAYNAYLASCKRRVKHATLPGTDMEAIRELYRNRPDGCEVDHIIPIFGDQVSGLHTPCNLRYLTDEENSCKNNKFDGTYENTGWRADLDKFRFKKAA